MLYWYIYIYILYNRFKNRTYHLLNIKYFKNEYLQTSK